MRDQLVAVKVFKVDAPPEQAEQIAEALQAVVQALPRHRGLVELIAAGVERDSAYLVMAHSDVPSLDSRLKPGASLDSSTPPVDAEQALVIVRTLAEAMDAAHGRGIVHGGLHPRDIFVDERGACRAAGFGVASALERAGVKVPVRRPYSPPERLTSAPIEPAADRFALGAIAFELLTGRRIAGTGSSAAARCTVSVPGADLDALRNALAAMLAEQPGHRPSTASAFATALSFALFPQGVARASAAASGAASGADRSPAAAARDDRRDASTAAGLGAGIGAGAMAAGASNGPRDARDSRDSRDNDGPSPDDLELFTRQGLFSGQPRQNTLRWEPVEVEPVVAPDEDPLELFAPESEVESSAPAPPEAAATPVEAAPDERASAAAAPVDAPESRQADAPAPEAEPEADISEIQTSRRDSILGLATTIVAPKEREVTPPASEQREDADEGHETTALPFVPIEGDDRLAQTSSRVPDSVLIDDDSRLDALDRLHPHDLADTLHHGDPPGHEGHLDQFDRLDRDDFDRDDFERDDVEVADQSDEADESITPAAAATAGVIAAGGVSPAAADLSHASHAHGSHAHASHSSGSHSSASPYAPPYVGEPDVDRAPDEHAHVDRADADHADADRTDDVSRSHPRIDRDVSEQWIAPTLEPVARSTSTLTDVEETADVGSSVRVVGLVLALGLAVGGAGGYLLGQRSSLRNASTFDQPAATDAARPPAGGDQAGAPAGAADASRGATPSGSGAAAATRPSTGAGASGAAASGGGAAGARPSASTPAGSGSAASGGGSAALAAATTGRLTITSTPARAEVAIDGVRRGVTPLTLRDLPVGSHTVRVTRGGYAPETRRVTVTAGRPAESITIDLEPIAPRTRPSASGGGPAATAAASGPERPARGSASGLGSLYVVSRPMGARVVVDGRVVGTTPLLLTDVSSGSHTIELQADGHKPWQTTVQVKIGERTRVAGSLEEGR